MVKMGTGTAGGAGTGTGTGVETREQSQDRNGDGSGERNERSLGDENGDEDGNEGGIGEGGGELKKRKKPEKNCRRDQALLFCTRHHLGKQGVALAGTRELLSQDLVPVHAHGTEGIK